MEITEIKMMPDFESGMECLQNPSLISRSFSIQSHHLLKWAALFLAVFATFTTVIRKIKLIRFHNLKPCSHQDEQIFDFSDDDVSLASSDDEGDEEETEPTRDTTSFRDRDFSVKGSSFFESCGGALSDFASGKSVVKLWEGLGLSLDFDEDLFGCGSRSVVSTWDGEVSGGFGDFPTVVLTAEVDGKAGGVIFGGYDTRMRRRVPSIYAEWGRAERVAGVSSGGGVGKVYVRDEVNGVVTVGDVRNVGRPLETGGETWWDAGGLTESM